MVYCRAMTEEVSFHIRKSRSGKGLFAARSIKKGEFVIEYTGKRMPTKEADELSTRYLFDLENGWTIDGSPMSNIARWINHSCEPNCETDIQDERILIFAVRDIAVGEELSFDYGEEYFDEFIKPVGCTCNACVSSPAPTHRLRDSLRSNKVLDAA